MAHQDDEMRCLGTMLKCKARGDNLFFITLTDGSAGIEGVTKKEAAEIRHREMSALAKEINAGYISIGEPDEYLYDTAEVRHKLIDAIRKSGANLIFTHYFEDYNIDHTTVSKLVRHCAMHSNLPFIKTESSSLKEHSAIFMIEPHIPMAFPATHFVDITEFEEQKILLLKNHASQEEAMQKGLKSGFEKLVKRPDSYWGEKAGCEYAECFIPMPARGAIKPYNTLP
jgi:LmbE family N-acetylglucosaminyl deacetylase